MNAPDGDWATGSFSTQLRVNFERWNRKTLRSPFVIIVSLVQPILTLLMFGLVFGGAASLVLDQTGFSGVGYVTFIVPAVVMQVSLASALTSGIGLVTDIESGMFQKVLVAPMTRTAIFAGKATSELLRVVVQVLLVLGLSIAVGASIGTGLAGVLGILLVSLLVALWFMAVSNMIGLLTGDAESISAGTNLLQFPLLFLSPAFLPLSALPEWVQTIAIVNPVTYATAAVRALVLNRDVLTVVEVSHFGGIYDTLVPAVCVLVALNVVFGGIAVVLLKEASGAGRS